MDNEILDMNELVVGQEYFIKFNVPTYEDIQKHNNGLGDYNIKNKISIQSNIFIELNNFVE